MSNTKLKFSIFNFQFSIGQRGVSLYLAVAIMAILLALALGISTILIGQIRVFKGMGDSVVAFYAADTGIEEAMYKYLVLNIPFSTSYAFSTVGNASYSVDAYSPSHGSSECPSPPYDWYCIKSFGVYQATKRAIEINQ